MKKVFYFFSVILLLGFYSCSNESDFLDQTDQTAGSVVSRGVSGVVDPAIGTSTTLTLTNALLSGGISTTGGVYWKDTYTPNTNVVSDIFTFSHSSMFDMYSYWDGFTVSNANDIKNYGAPGSSDGWVAHQWSCMPGSGVNTSGSVAPGEPGQSGDPFIVAYWSSYMDPKNPAGNTFDETQYSNWVKIGSTGQYQVLGLKIANHPWPYYGNLAGDGFANAFNKAGDFFDLYIYGVTSDNIITSRIVVSLAKNELGGIENLKQDNKWMTVNAADLRSLGNVKYLLFQMSSSDSDPIYGMNTAAYFCLDKLQVRRVR